MKTKEKHVKADGKVVGKVNVPIYDTVAEASKDLTEPICLAKINRQVASDLMNELRASLTREISPISRLQRIAKTNPSLQKKIDELVKSFGGDPTAK